MLALQIAEFVLAVFGAWWVFNVARDSGAVIIAKVRTWFSREKAALAAKVAELEARLAAIEGKPVTNTSTVPQ